MLTLLLSKPIITIIVILVSFLLKILSIKYINHITLKEGADKRLYINTLKNVVNLLVIVLVFYIWHVELRQFAFSIAAFIVAIVLATRELIQCFIGFIYLSSTTIFRIGDWVQVGGHVGEVTATDWAKITLLEVDTHSYGYTGKSVFIPNSQLMTQPIKNLNFMRRYVHHSITVVKTDNVTNPFLIKKALIDKTNSYCEAFNVVAERYNELIENRLGVTLSGVNPSVEFSSSDLGRIKTTVSVFCPTERVKEIEQLVTEDIYTLWQTITVPVTHKELNDE